MYHRSSPRNVSSKPSSRAGTTIVSISDGSILCLRLDGPQVRLRVRKVLQDKSSFHSRARFSLRFFGRRILASHGQTAHEAGRPIDGAVGTSRLPSWTIGVVVPKRGLLGNYDVGRSLFPGQSSSRRGAEPRPTALPNRRPAATPATPALSLCRRMLWMIGQ